MPTDVEKCQDRVECFNADLKADMERWQNNKRQDFRQLLMGMADKNIQYYEKVCVIVWALAGTRVVYFPLKWLSPHSSGSLHTVMKTRILDIWSCSLSELEVVVKWTLRLCSFASQHSNSILSCMTVCFALLNWTNYCVAAAVMKKTSELHILVILPE